jgi:hypothetical protein
MPVKCARAVQTKVVRFRKSKRPAPAASFGCCRFRSNFVGFASVPGGYQHQPAMHPPSPLKCPPVASKCRSQTWPVNSQGAPLSGVVLAVCCSACVGCLRWIPAQKDAKTQFLVPWHPTVAATNNLMTDLYSANEMSGVWPGLRSQKIRWGTGRRTCATCTCHARASAPAPGASRFTCPCACAPRP